MVKKLSTDGNSPAGITEKDTVYSETLMVQLVRRTKPMERVTLEPLRSLHCARKDYLFDNSDSALTIRMDVLISLGSPISRRKSLDTDTTPVW